MKYLRTMGQRFVFVFSIFYLAMLIYILIAFDFITFLSVLGLTIFILLMIPVCKWIVEGEQE